jgi:hypothetical protein
MTGCGGQAMTECLVVAAALAVALLMPYLHGQSVAALLLDAILGSLRAQAFLISVL